MEMNRPKAPASETLQTADLDNKGILQLQDQSMRQQDAELEELERTVTSTKVLALAFLKTAISAILDYHCYMPILPRGKVRPTSAATIAVPCVYCATPKLVSC